MGQRTGPKRIQQQLVWFWEIIKQEQALYNWMNSLSEDTSIHIRGGVRSYKLPEQNTNATNAIQITPGTPHFVESLLPYIAFSDSSSPYTCWSSEPSLEYLSHQPPSLVLCELC